MKQGVGGNTTDAVTLSSNAYAGDVVNLANTAANFNNPTVGNGKPVNVTGITLTGVDAGNYTYNTTANTSANITATPTPNPANLNQAGLIPVVPAGISNQAPLSLQEDIRSGVSTPAIVPVVASGVALGSMPLGGTLVVADKHVMLTVVQAPRDNQLQSLFPAPLVTPIYAPKQGRN